MLNRLFGKPSLVSPADALPGRPAPVPTAATHHVLGTPLLDDLPDGYQQCGFGCGCFWGAEKAFWRLPGVYRTAVGYQGGYTPNPTYEEVCSGATGHTEVVAVAWNPEVIGFADLLKLFWECHDPTQGMAQGNDRGTQYRSGIYTSSAAQTERARDSLAAYQQSLTAAGLGRITTEVVADKPFFAAEAYHQQYLAKPGCRPYCSAMPTGVRLRTFDGADFRLPEAVWEHYDWRQKHCVLFGESTPIRL